MVFLLIRSTQAFQWSGERYDVVDVITDAQASTDERMRGNSVESVRHRQTASCLVGADSAIARGSFAASRGCVAELLPPEDSLTRDETFGPVQIVVAVVFDDIDTAIEVMQDCPCSEPVAVGQRFAVDEFSLSDIANADVLPRKGADGDGLFSFLDSNGSRW